MFYAIRPVVVLSAILLLIYGTILGLRHFDKAASPLKTVECPATVFGENGSYEWILYTHDPNGQGPYIDIDEDDGTCVLTVERTTGTDTQSIDWRMGLLVDLPEGIKDVRFSLSALSDVQISAPGASVYLFDGTQSVGQSVGAFSPDSRKIVLTMPIDPARKAGPFEFWVRIALHSAVDSLGEIRLSDIMIAAVPP